MQQQPQLEGGERAQPRLPDEEGVRTTAAPSRYLNVSETATAVATDAILARKPAGRRSRSRSTNTI